MLTRNRLPVYLCLVCLVTLLAALPGMAQVPPTASASFSPSTVVAGGTKTTTYTLTISNPNGADLTNVHFTGSYPAGVVADQIGNYTCATSNLLNPPGNPGGTNGGSGSFTAGGFNFTLNTLSAGDSCTVIFRAHASPVVTTTLITETTSTITSNEAAAATAASATLTVNPQVATSFSIAGLSTLQVFTQNPMVINCLDQAGNLDTAYNGTVNLTSTEDPLLVYSSGNPITLANGTMNFNVSPKTTGVWTVTATDSVNPSITGISNAFTATPGPTSQLLVSATTPQTAGTSFSFTVTATDFFGNLTPAYAGTVSFSSTDALAGLPSSSTLVNGTKTFIVNLHTPGNQTLTAADVPNSLTGTSASITVNAAPSPTLAQAFGAGSIIVNNSTSLTFTVTNPNASTSVQGIGFSDTLPAGLIVATPNGQAGTCLSTGAGVIAGTPSATAGGSTISLTSLSLAASSSCTFIVNVKGTTTGAKSNTTGAITSVEGATGSTSNASLTVNPAATPTTTTASPGQSSTYGQSVTLSATVTVTAGGAPVTTGTMTFFDSTIGANVAAGVALNSSGVASTSTSTLTAGGVGGVHIIDTIYVPGAGFSASSDNLTITVAKAPLTVTAQNASMVVGAAVPAFSPSYSGFVNSEGAGVLAGAPSLTTTATSASPAGAYTITSAVGTLGSANYAFSFVNGTLTVIAVPTITNAFGAGTVGFSLNVSLSFTITNPAANVIPLTGLSFSDTLPAGLVVAAPNGLAGSCGGGTITAVAGSSTASLAGATLASGASCTFSITVKASNAGVKSNTTGAISSTESGAGAVSNTATVTVAVAATPSKAFGAASIAVNGTTSLTFTFSNSNPTVALTGIGLNDSLPAGLNVATPNGLTGTCLATAGGVTAGSVTAVAGSGTVSIATLGLAANTSCSFAVNVLGVAAGVQNNTTAAVTSVEGGPGATASANVTVTQASQTITFGALPGHVYGDAAFSLSATSTSSLAVAFASTTLGVCTTSGTTVTIVGAGACSITASQAGNANYSAAPNVIQGFAVTKSVLTVTASNASKVSGSANPTLSAVITGFLNGDTAATAVTGSAALATTASTASTAGSYPITAAQGTLAAANYTFVFVNGTLTVAAPPSPPALGATLVINSGTPQTTTVNTAFASVLQVTVLDQSGNPVPNATVTFNAPAAGAGLSPAGATVTANGSGVASLSVKANTVAGSYIVSAYSGSGFASFNLTNSPGPAATLTATAGTPQTANVGLSFNSPLQASVQDGFGNGLPGVSVTFSIVQTSNAGAIFPAGTTALTNAAGQVNLPVQANGAAGSYSVSAVSSGLTPVSFALTNASPATLVVPALMSGSAIQLGLAWANPTGYPITLALTAYGYDGSMISGTGIQNPAQLTVPAHGQIAKEASEAFGAAILGRPGWVAVQPSDPNAGGGFFLLYDNALQTIDGGPFVATPAAALVFPHVTNATILHVVNTGFATSRTVVMRVYDNSGNPLGTTTFELDIHSGWSGHVTDLLPSLGSVNGYVVIDTRNPFEAPLSLAGMLSYQTGGDSAIVMAQDVSATIQTGYAVDIASGAGYSSQLRLINTSAAPQQVQLSLSGVSVQRTIPPNGRLDEALGAMFNLPSSRLISGYLSVQSNGAGVNGFVEIASSNGLALTAEPITAAAAAQTDLVFSQVAQGFGFFTGLAFVNPLPTAATVNIEVDSSTGSVLATTTITVSPGGQVVGQLSDFCPSIQNQQGGSVHVTASQPIFGLELFGSAGLSNSFLSYVPSGTF